MHQHRLIAWSLSLVLLCLLGISLGAGASGVQAVHPDGIEPGIQRTTGFPITCVNSTGTGCHPDCGGCYSSIQAGVDNANMFSTVRIAYGTYTGSGVEVVDITKSLTLQGSYSQDCGTLGAGETIIDGEDMRTGLNVDKAGGLVTLNDLTITRGIGDANCDVTTLFDYGGCGGGLYVSETPISVNRCIFTANTGNYNGHVPGTGAGGGAFIANYQSGAFAEIISSSFISNIGSVYSVGWGGGMHIEAGSAMFPAEVDTCAFSENIASIFNEGHGGGAFVAGYVNIDESEFIRNKGGDQQALYGYGGGIYVQEARGMNLTNTDFLHNVAVTNPSHATTKASQGGAIYVTTDVTMTMINNVIAWNTARDAGTGVYLTAPELTVHVWAWHNTIASNKGNPSAGVFTLGEDVGDLGTTSAELKNNIFAGNPFGVTVDNYIKDYLLMQKNCVCNNIEGFPGDFAIVQDPKLTPEYYPREGSPVIQAGFLLTGHPALATDKDGISRPQGSMPNLGAYETTREAAHLPLLFRK